MSFDQLSFLPTSPGENRKQYKRWKRNWENAFQKWSDKCSQDGRTHYGKCGFGSMCDWCDDPSHGRPCVRALNAMRREKGIKLSYADFNFERLWDR